MLRQLKYLVLKSVNQYTTFAVPSFTDSKDTIGVKIFQKMDDVHWGSLSSEG